MAVKVSPYNWDRVGRNRDRKDLQTETNRRVHADPIAQAATEATGEDNSEVSGEDNAGKPGYDAYGSDISDSGIPGVNRTEEETRRILEEAFSGVDWDSPGMSSSPAPASGGRVGGVDWGAAGSQKSGQGGFEDWSNALYKFMSDYFGPSRKDEDPARAVFEQTFGGNRLDEFKEDWRRRPQRESVYADDKGGASLLDKDTRAEWDKRWRESKNFYKEQPTAYLVDLPGADFGPSFSFATIKNLARPYFYGPSERAAYMSVAKDQAKLQRDLSLANDFVAGKLTSDGYKKAIDAAIDESSVQVPRGRIDAEAYEKIKGSIPELQKQIGDLQASPAFRARMFFEGDDSIGAELVQKYLKDEDQTWQDAVERAALMVPKEARGAAIDRLTTAIVNGRSITDEKMAEIKQELGSLFEQPVAVKTPTDRKLARLQ